MNFWTKGMEKVDCYVYYTLGQNISYDFDKKNATKFNFTNYVNGKYYHSWDKFNTCKIGETTNIKTRGYSLRTKMSEDICKFVHWKGTKAERQLLEDYLHNAMMNKYKTQLHHDGNDHFICRNSKILKSTYNNFFAMVEEGMELLEKMRGEKISYTMYKGCHLDWEKIV